MQTLYKISFISALVVSLGACGSNPTQSNVVASPAVTPTPVVVTPVVTTPTTTTPTTPLTTIGEKGLSVSTPFSYDTASDKATFGTVSTTTGFVLTPTGSITGGTVTGLSITTSNATTTGATLTINADATNTVTSTAATSSAPARAVAYLKTNENAQKIVVEQPIGYSYTQFGSWYQCSANCVTGINTKVGGLFSRGDATAPANIPTTGTATYTGTAIGVYVDAAGAMGDTAATMKAVTNFATRSMSFSTTGTTLAPSSANLNLPTVANANLDMTGTLTYGGISAGGRLIAVGNLTATGLSGSAQAQFNGPAAEELGGIYTLSGTAGKMIGAFAGKK